MLQCCRVPSKHPPTYSSHTGTALYETYVVSGVTGGGGGRGAECPPRLPTGKFLLTYREKEAKKWKMGKMGRKRRKIVKKGEGGKLKMEGGKSSRIRGGPFFFLFILFCFVLFCFVLFCFFCFCFCFLFFCFFVFSKRRKFVLGVPKWKFSTGKKDFTPGKKSGKITCQEECGSVLIMPLLPLQVFCNILQVFQLMRWGRKKMFYSCWHRMVATADLWKMSCQQAQDMAAKCSHNT